MPAAELWQNHLPTTKRNVIPNYKRNPVPLHRYFIWIRSQTRNEALTPQMSRRHVPSVSTLHAAVEHGAIRPGYQADELLRAVATLCKANPDGDPAETRKMVALLVDGLRCRT